MSDRARARAFLALCLARFREYYREPEVLFWALRLPGPALGRARGGVPRPAAGALARRSSCEGPGAERLARAPCAGRRSSWPRRPGRRRPRAALRMGRADVVVSPPADPAAPVEYRLDPSRPEAGVARARVDDALQRAAGRVDPLRSRERGRRREPGGRYVDFLVPGLIGMNLMSAGMWGVGYALVDMRIKKLLKRLLATPMRPADFMARADGDARRLHVRRGRASSSASPRSPSASPCAARSPP